MTDIGAPGPRTTASAAPEWRQVLSVARLEMTSYVRSWPGLLFALFMPTGLLLVATSFWYPDEARAVAVPDMAALSVLSSGLFSIGVAITEQRKDGTLKTYLSSPLRARTYLAGQVLDRIAVTVLGNVVMVTFALLVLDVRTSGGLATYALVLLVALAAMLSLGFLLASRFRSVETAGATSSLLFFVAMLASGFFADPSSWPGWVARILDALPFKSAVDLLRGVWLGEDADVWLTDLGVVTGWLVVFAVLATRLFRWTPDDR